MGLLDKLTGFDDVFEALQNWQPAPAGDERGYEDALGTFLNGRFGDDVIFRRQYRRANSIADVYVKFPLWGDLVIEVKKDLAGRQEFYRLVGQSFEYLHEWRAHLLVVLCGKSDPVLAKLVVQALRVLSEGADGTARVLVCKHSGK